METGMDEIEKKHKTHPKLPIGVSDFMKLRKGGYYYLDKTFLINDIVNTSAEVILLPRPRRFGKTLNLSMLQYFFEKTDGDVRSVFKETMIFKTETFEKYHAKYPVIFLTFKDLKDMSWDEAYTICEN